MYKSYSDSYLLTKNKRTLIQYLRIAEHNHKVCEETIEQQYTNCMELLKKERAEAIDEFQEWLKTQIVDIDNKTKEILVVVEGRWELATEQYRKEQK